MGKRGNSLSKSYIGMSELTLAEKKAAQPKNNLSSLKLYLDALYEKRNSTREKALELLIEAFENKVQNDFVEKNFHTLLNQYVNIINQRSGEKALAAQAIGLLALTRGFGDDARGLFHDSIIPLSQLLNSGFIDTDVLDSLAVVTFVGGNGAEETEKALQIIWQFIDPKPLVVKIKIPYYVWVIAISCWLFLYTSIDSRALNSESWQKSASYFLSILNKDDSPYLWLRMAAGEALALLLEIGCQDSNAVKELKEKILDRVQDLSVEAGGGSISNISKIHLSDQRKLFGNILEFLEDGCCPETSIKIGDDIMKISTWSELIQWNFFKRYLKGGFFKYMQESELLLDVFKFTPREKRVLGNQQKLTSTEKRMYKSPNSASNKERTIARNKQRASVEGGNFGQFAGDYVE